MEQRVVLPVELDPKEVIERLKRGLLSFGVRVLDDVQSLPSNIIGFHFISLVGMKVEIHHHKDVEHLAQATYVIALHTADGNLVARYYLHHACAVDCRADSVILQTTLRDGHCCDLQIHKSGWVVFQDSEKLMF